MYNLRYHLASLMSVFFALALGLLLGGLLADRNPADAQDALVQNIERDISTTREQNAQLRTQAQESSDFAQVLTDDFISGRLDGLTVLVLGMPGRDVNTMVTDLETAGAATLIVEPVFDAETETWSYGDITLPEGLGGIVSLFEPVDNEATGDNGIAYRDDYFAFLAELQANLGVKVVSVSPEVETNKMVSVAYDREGFSGTNQLGTAYGRYTVVALLSGADAGLYGTDHMAAALYPPLPPEVVQTPEPIADPVPAEQTPE
jgi:hypothetical protein